MHGGTGAQRRSCFAAKAEAHRSDRDIYGSWDMGNEEGGNSMKQTALHLVEMRSFPVQLGELVFYAGSWKLTGVRQYAEQGGVLGTGYVTNSSARAGSGRLDPVYGESGGRDITAGQRHCREPAVCL